MFEYIYRKARMNTYSSDIFDSGLVPRFWYVPIKNLKDEVMKVESEEIETHSNYPEISQI